MEQNHLTHHGILGMRWGVRRFQNKDGSLTAAGKKRRKEDDENTEQETKEQYEARKKTALSSGSAKDILEFKGDLTNNELQTAIARINFEKQLADISAKDTKTWQDKVKDIGDSVETIDKAAQKGIGAWNTVAKIVNSLSDTELPVIDGGDSRRKRAEEAEKKAKEKAEAADKEKRKKFIESATPEQIRKAYGTLSVDDLDQLSKRFKYEDEIEGRFKSRDKAEAKAQAKKEKADKDNKNSDKDNKNSDKDNKNSDKDNKNQKQSEPDVEKVTGEVFGEGTSRRSGGESPNTRQSRETIYMDLPSIAAPKAGTKVNDIPDDSRTVAGSVFPFLLEEPKK